MKRFPTRIPLVLLVALGLAAGGRLPAEAAERPIDFNRDIRPILSDNCFACHGPDENERQADLRLDVREAAIEYGAITPGEPDDSLVLERIFSDDPDLVMPPADSQKRLTAQQKALLKRWIAEGGEYAVHWAYAPLERPAVPETQDLAGWVRNPIDAFVLEKLEEREIRPSAEADKRALLRRLYLDLIGLPPKPHEVEAFLLDNRADAYDRVVERLLASPYYGERMATPWLDVVRYADTVGYHGDQNQNSWAYRDYVIESFNENKPFDQFTIEQLAGDLLPEPTTEQIIATCFNRLNMMTREGGAQPKEYLAKYAADRARTVSMAWLGQTMGCAECHDHKFDPITTRDFYSMEAFFADIKQYGVYAEYSYTPNPELRNWSNDHPFPPEVPVESPYLVRRLKRLNEEKRAAVAAAHEQLEEDAELAAAFAAWRAEIADYLAEHSTGWETPAAELVKEPGNGDKKDDKQKGESTADEDEVAAVQSDGSLLFKQRSASNDVIALSPAPGWLAALRVELLPSDEHEGRILRGGAKSTTLQLSAAIERRRSANDSPDASEGENTAREVVRFRHADAALADPRYASTQEIIGIQGGWKTVAAKAEEPHVGVWLLDEPTRLSEGDQVVLSIPRNMAGQVRISLSPLAPDDAKQHQFPAELLDAFSPAADVQGEENTGAALHATYLRSTGWNREAYGQLKGLEQEILACRDGKTPVMITVAVEPAVTRVLPRGNWQDESGAIVEPAVPHFLPQPEVEGRRLTRLDLARWLVSPENPLTARTVVNRLWKQFFGTGLSAQVDDLGAQGEAPSHPELLDWLAVEFRESGWDMKHMVRLLVTSAAYRQDANLRPELAEIDPNNRLLASQSPRRLEAEFVRDNALAIAGLIHLEQGGPPCKPYQPEGYYANLQFPDRVYVADRDERQYRRGVYMHWQRTFLHPMLANFDAPSREDCIALRTQANSPQQALTLLNDPTFVEASRVFAAKLLADAETDPQRLDLAYRRALARPIRPAERESLLVLLGKLREKYESSPDQASKLLAVGLAENGPDIAPAELAAWTHLCRVILNLHETITRY